MSDSEGDDAPERVAKNCLKLLLDSTNSLVAKADENETEDVPETANVEISPTSKLIKKHEEKLKRGMTDSVRTDNAIRKEMKRYESFF